MQTIELPDNFDDIPESSGGTPKPPPASYVCKVMRVKSTHAKSGRPMLVVDFDIAEGPFANWYAHDNDDRASKNFDAKWLRLYQLVDGNSAGIFKHLLGDFERSNKNFVAADHKKGNSFDVDALLGLTVGLVCDGEEYSYNDNVRMDIRPSRSLAADKVRKGAVPEPRIKGIDGNWRKASESRPPKEREPPAPLSDLEPVDATDIPF